MPTDKIMVWADYPQDFRPAFTLPEHVPDSYEGYLSHLYGLNHGAPPPPVPDTLEPTELFVNAGRWLWQCRVCLAAVPVEPGSPVICYQCGSGGWRMPAFPDNRAELEAELLKQPGHRLSAPLRNWQPGWTLEYLQERTRLAQAAIAGGNPYPRSLSIGSTRAWAGGEVLTAANKNTFESAVMDDLAGRNGPVELEDVLQLFTRTTGERNALTAALGMVLVNSTNNLLEYYNGTNWRAAGFDLHEDIGTELTTLATADRIALSDEGEPGDPNVWASLDTLSSFLHGRISPQLIGSGAFNVQTSSHFAAEAQSADITLPTPGANEIWMLMAVTSSNVYTGTFLGSWVTDLDAGAYSGQGAANNRLIVAARPGAGSVLALGHTAGGKLLVWSNATTNVDIVALFRFPQ